MAKREEMIEIMAENLPVLRKKAGVTQEELAETLGISKYTVLSVEKKRRRMTWNTFLSLFLVFSMNEKTNGMLSFLGLPRDEVNSVINKEKEKETDYGKYV